MLANSAVLQTDKSDVHSEISAQQVVELPYNGGEGKNFQSLLYLVPGAGIPATREANSEAGNPQRAQTLFMNGVSSTGNSTKLDGATVSYPWLPVNIAYVPPSEAIETVNISTNSFDAEQGAAGGAAVNVSIKSGTNQLHGVAFERNQNNNMTAVNYFSHTSPLNKNIFNQYGFAIGGPIWIPKIVHGKNKLFFFADYQGTKRRQYAASTNLTLPTAAMRTGDLSATGVTIYDPLTGNADGTGRTPFANNTIPTARIDPASATLTGLLPALTRPSAYTSNYDAYGNTQYNRSNWDFKVNYNPTDKADGLGTLQHFAHGYRGFTGVGTGGGRRRVWRRKPGPCRWTRADHRGRLHLYPFAHPAGGWQRRLHSPEHWRERRRPKRPLRVEHSENTGDEWHWTELLWGSRISGYRRREHGQHEHGQPVPIPRQPVHHRHQPE